MAAITGTSPSVTSSSFDVRSTSKDLVSQLKEAHTARNLRAFLENVNPNDLVANLSPTRENWAEFPYEAVLQEACAIYKANARYGDERVNGEIQGLRLINGLLCVLTQRSSLNLTTEYARRALDVFDTPEDRPIFIEVLKHSSTTNLNTIAVKALLWADRELGGFIPNFLRPLFQVEQDFQIARDKAYQEADARYQTLLRSAELPTYLKV